MISQPETLLLRVSRMRELTPRIRAYELRAASGDDLPLVTPGSHIALPVQSANGKQDFRLFSICSNPNQREFYEIAIVMDEQDHDGSSSIFNYLDLGTQLACGFPSNNFHLHADSSPAILIAGDMGIAPIKTIAHTLALRGRRFTLHYACSTKKEMAFIQELEALFPRNLIPYAADEGKQLDTMSLLADATSNTLFYACGPKDMLAEIETNARLLGIAKDRIQVESLFSDADEKDKELLLELAYSNTLIQVNADQSLLNAVRDAGVNVSFDCCAGDCGSCATKVLAGDVEHCDHVLSDDQKAQGFMCLCVSRGRGKKLVLAL